MFRFHSGFVVFMAGILCASLAYAAPIPSYSVNPLGEFSPVDINNNGQILGETRMSNGHDQAVVISGKSIQYLGTLDGSYSYGTAMNNHGDVVGYAEVANGSQEAFLYSNGSMVRVDGLGDRGSWAYGINDRGEIVGSSNNGPYGAYIFDIKSGVIQTIYGLVTITGVGESGTILGEYGYSFVPGHAGAVSNGVAQDLGTLGGSYGAARRINDKGQIVGNSYTAGDTYSHAFLYSDGMITDLDSIEAKHNSNAWDINNLGEVVGQGNGAGFVYKNGILNNLNSLIDPALGWTVYDARAINDNGQIAAFGCSHLLGCQTLRLDPTNAEVPEPGTLWLCLLCLAMLPIARSTRRK